MRKKANYFFLTILSISLALFVALISSAQTDLIPQINVPFGQSQLSAPEIQTINGAQYVVFPWIGQYIRMLYSWLLGAGSVAAVIMMMYAGFLWLSAAGEKSKIDEAKQKITSSLLGVVLLFSSYTILYLIDPDLVKLTGISTTPMTKVGVKLNETDTQSVVTPKSETNQSGGGTSTGDGNVSSSCKPACNKQDLDAAIANNSENIDGNILRSFVMTEGCNPGNSPAGACGYTQLMPNIRANLCGIGGGETASCKKVQNDIQLAVNCGAKLFKEQKGWCWSLYKNKCNFSDFEAAAVCYNAGVGERNKALNSCYRGEGSPPYADRFKSNYEKCK